MSASWGLFEVYQRNLPNSANLKINFPLSHTQWFLKYDILLFTALITNYTTLNNLFLHRSYFEFDNKPITNNMSHKLRLNRTEQQLNWIQLHSATSQRMEWSNKTKDKLSKSFLRMRYVGCTLAFLTLKRYLNCIIISVLSVNKCWAVKICTSLIFSIISISIHE